MICPPPKLISVKPLLMPIQPTPATSERWLGSAISICKTW
jgi:hypothetical protein